MTKWFFIVTMLIAVVFFSSMGCVTTQLWENKAKPVPYNEKILSFYTNKDEGQMVFIGEKYHYIFSKNAKAFIELLQAGAFLKLGEKNLYIRPLIDREDPRVITTDISVRFAVNRLNQEQISWLALHGFKRVGSEYVQSYIQIEGKRYFSKGEINKKALKLIHPLPVKVAEYKKTKNPLFQIAMTPLSLTADAGIIILAAGAAIIVSPVLLFNAITE
ncbi:conserved hypothetical protein, membrane [Candidatus Thiomargarita nelsonii]|uniref:Lipoprotein n=1 Tax=Candidatus Thiomargarita nelsonii TaxID=1003181 RepID=A0A176S2S2_9GAMM|nr:conserved hypothetical protein, membrane [Candidatus Thiomargarita nelsonii]